jgi:hypothetical protein
MWGEYFYLFDLKISMRCEKSIKKAAVPAIAVRFAFMSEERYLPIRCRVNAVK